jgi:hypothetical protein
MEVWKDIQGYEGLYQVSNLGRVKSLEKSIPHLGYYRKVKEKVLSGTMSNYGYLVYKLGGKIKGKKIYGHRLVAQTFLPNNENKPFVNHINGIKTDNRIENLEWCTQLENVDHAYKFGLMDNYGEKNPMSKITESIAKEIKYGHKNLNQTEIAKLYNMKQNSISQIINGIRWKKI